MYYLCILCFGDEVRVYMNVSSNEKRKAGGIYEPSVTVLPSNAATSAISVGDIYIYIIAKSMDGI